MNADKSKEGNYEVGGSEAVLMTWSGRGKKRWRKSSTSFGKTRPCASGSNRVVRFGRAAIRSKRWDSVVFWPD